ncbi:hypothetical protein MRB53_013130 [Persea americana]|uniref:Uncharacterized protein n=1 Tax=Persea americana TaxID=3435 RepID=A0ACC2K755_PERAE|nr:hypothetical protein MRB53_013130 [Persea americana]
MNLIYAWKDKSNVVKRHLSTVFIHSPLHARKSRPKTLRSRSLDSRGAIKISAVTPSKSKDNSDSLVEGTASNMHAFDDNRVSEVTPIMLLMKLIYVQC